MQTTPAVTAALLAATITTALPAAAEENENRPHTQAQVFVLDAAKITSLDVTSRTGHIKVAPYTAPGTQELPEWIEPMQADLPSFDPATDVVIVAQVHAAKRGWLDHAELVPTIRNGELVLKAEWADEKAKQDTFGVDYVVHMPRVTPVEAATGVGGILINKSQGAVNGKAGTGDITIESSVGPVHAMTGVGRVRISFDEHRPGHAVADTGIGGVTVLGFKGGRLNSGQGDVTGVLAASPADDVKLSTGMGDVRLTLPDQLNATVESVTSMGTVYIGDETRMAGQRKGGTHSMHTAVHGTGRPTIQCVTSMGDVITVSE